MNVAKKAKRVVKQRNSSWHGSFLHYKISYHLLVTRYGGKETDVETDKTVRVDHAL
jgi:hypothetical protein